MSDSSVHILTEITTRLKAARRKELSVAARGGVVYILLVLLAASLVITVFENWFYFSVPVRTVLFWIVLGVAGAGLAVYVLLPLLRLLGIVRWENDEQTARKVGEKFPTIKDHLVNILQLRQEGASHYSPELIDASFEDARREMVPHDFLSIVDKAPFLRWLRSLIAIACVWLLLFTLFPTSLSSALYRLGKYSMSFEQPAPFRFVVEPGNKEIVKGESVRITVRIEGEPRKEILFSARPEGQRTYDSRTLTAGAAGAFSLELPSLKASTRYFVSAENVMSEEFLLSVTDRPVITTLRLSLAFPAYARIAARELDNNTGDVTALKGTRIGFALESNKELSSAALIFNDGSEQALTVTGKKATGTMQLVKERTYHLRLKDRETVENADPIEYSLKVLADAYPTASIELPGQNVDIAENASLNMVYRIKDDYGFSRLELAYKLTASRYEKPAAEFNRIVIPLPEGTKPEALIPYLWNLSTLSLVPEDVVSYFVEVYDNDNISGPKSARSDIYTLRLPSLEEVFADLDKGHETSLENMKEALQQAQEAKKDLEELQQQVKKNPRKPDWQEQKKAEELGKKYQEIQKKLDEVNKTVQKMTEDMQKNQVLSKETLEKYQELQQLMEQLSSPEFAEAMKKMQQAMQQMNPEQMKQAMQNFQFSEENFRKSIERTMNLLKRIQIEQKLDEAVKRAEELQRQQEELAKKTEATNPQDRQQLNDQAQRQKDMKQQLDQLQKEMAELQKKMQEFPQEMPLQEMQDAQQNLSDSQLDQQMDQIAQDLQQQQRQQAMQGQKQAMQKMGNLLQKMKRAQDAMKQNQQREIVNEMRKSVQDLLALSKRQENLKNEARQLEQQSQRFRENAAEQMEIMRDLSTVANAMTKLSQKTFAVSPEMGKSIGDAMRAMNNALQSLDQRNGAIVTQQQGDAMAALNQAASQMQSAMNSMMQGQGGQGMGMAGFMQRMQQMTGQQQGLNQSTQGMGMSQARAAEMGRLAGEQGMIRKSLEQLAKEAAQSGDLSKMLGDLNKIAQEMREVQTDLAQNNVTPETLQKQERILSRMLDSQRSARERDFEKKRKAESGKDVVRKSPGAIELSTQEGKTKLRQDMLKALEEGYARDYEDVIRKYFELLEQEGKEN
jgi:hypothetical protein